MAIQFIDSKCHIMKRKSCKPALSVYYTCVSRDLLLMASGVDTQTGTHTHIPTRKQKRFQETRRAQLKAARTWFNKCFSTATGINLFSKSLILLAIYPAIHFH